MFLNFQKNLILFFLLLFVVSAGGQTVQPVKVDELRQSDRGYRGTDPAISAAFKGKSRVIGLFNHDFSRFFGNGRDAEKRTFCS
jgi:hypothetical protein